MADWTAPRVGDLRVDVLSPQGVELGTIDGVLGGSLDAATAREIRTVGQLDVIGDRNDWLTIRLRPVFVMTSPVVGEYPLGVYLPATPRATHDGTGQAALSVDLYDRSQVLAGDGPLETYTVPVGAPLIGRVRKILTTYGEGPHAIADSTATARAAMTWDGDASWLRIVNDLLDAAGFFALSYDGEGTARAEPYVPAESRPIMWDLTDGAASIRTPELPVTADYFGLYNRVKLVASSSGAEGEMVAVAANQSDGPFSRDQLGRWVTRFESGRDAADQAALQAQADRLLDESRQLAAGATVTHGWLPDVTLNSRVHVGDGPGGVDLTGTVSRQTIPLDPAALVTSHVGTVAAPEDWVDSLTPPEPPAITWAEVTSVSPLQIRRDGDTAPLDAEPGTLTAPVVGDRVAVYRNGTQLIVVGRAGGDNITWDQITGKPSTFPPSAHTHPVTVNGGFFAGSTDVWGVVIIPHGLGATPRGVSVITATTSNTPIDHIADPIIQGVNGAAIIVRVLRRDTNSPLAENPVAMYWTAIP